MTAFSYLALDKKGKKLKGVAEADNAKQVRQQLRDKQLIPLEVSDITDASSHQKNKKRFRKNKKIAVADLTLMTRQMSTLLAAGIPIDEMLAAVADQTEKHHVQSIILGVRAKVLEGYSLGAALDAFPSAFPSLYRTTVLSGEKSGKLDYILLQLAEYTEQQHKLRQKIIQALLYPSLMTFVSINVVIFLLIYVVPKIVNVFSETQQMLPVATEILLSLSSFLLHNGWYILVVFIIAAFFFYKGLKIEKFRLQYDAFVLKLPVIGKTVKTINEARFGRTFGILTAASVPVLEAMKASALLISPLPMKYAVKEAINKVREGASIHYALKQTGYFAPMFVHLVASGESSGKLENMLQRAAVTQEDDVAAVIQNVLTLFEPILILVMGAVVLFIVLAIMLPIFAMDQFPGAV